MNSLNNLLLMDIKDTDLFLMFVSPWSENLLSAVAVGGSSKRPLSGQSIEKNKTASAQPELWHIHCPSVCRPAQRTMQKRGGQHCKSCEALFWKRHGHGPQTAVVICLRPEQYEILGNANKMPIQIPAWMRGGFMRPYP